MKTMKLLSLPVLVFLSASAMAQDCSTYFYLQDQKTIELTVLNKKGNVTGKNIYTVTGVTANGSARTASIQSEFFDAKGKSVSKSVNTIKCENGIMMMDMKVFIPTAQQEQMKTTTAGAAEVYLEYPAGMKVGDDLKDGQFQLEFENINGLKSSIEISITGRKVLGQETITTAAGTWNCFKISANNKITTRIAGIGLPIRANITEWFAPGFGIVKTESAGGSTEITSIK
jgi:hypothetical protein